MAINTEIAEKVLRSIFAEPDRHEQRTWLTVPEDPEGPYVIDSSTMSESCGTSACIAGWAALHAGWKVEVHLSGLGGGRRLDLVSPEGEKVNQDVYNVDLKTAGRDALGISNLEAASIFHMMDERFAVVSLYSLVKTGDLHEMIHELGVSETYLRAQAEFSPALDILNTLEEPVLETADQ